MDFSLPVNLCHGQMSSCEELRSLSRRVLMTRHHLFLLQREHIWPRRRVNPGQSPGSFTWHRTCDLADLIPGGRIQLQVRDSKTNWGGVEVQSLRLSSKVAACPFKVFWVLVGEVEPLWQNQVFRWWKDIMWDGLWILLGRPVNHVC